MIDKIDKLKEKIEEHEERITEIENELNSEGPMKKSNSLREFVEKVDPDDNYERALAIGYYLEHYEENNYFDNKDIEVGFRKCKQTYSNYRVLTKRLNKNKNWFMKANTEDDKGKWVLSADGEEYIEEVIENE